MDLGQLRIHNQNQECRPKFSIPNLILESYVKNDFDVNHMSTKSRTQIYIATLISSKLFSCLLSTGFNSNLYIETRTN